MLPILVHHLCLLSIAYQRFFWFVSYKRLLPESSEGHQYLVLQIISSIIIYNNRVIKIITSNKYRTSRILIWICALQRVSPAHFASMSHLILTTFHFDYSGPRWLNHHQCTWCLHASHSDAYRLQFILYQIILKHIYDPSKCQRSLILHKRELELLPLILSILDQHDYITIVYQSIWGLYC